jgi:hypothetical protein
MRSSENSVIAKFAENDLWANFRLCEVALLGQQGTEVQSGRSSILVCTSPCALLALRFSETEASPGKYPATPARARGSACRRGVAALSAGLAAQIRREVSGELWRRTPQLVYGLVYKGLGALAGASPVLQLSCKWWKNKRADERTRTADLLITSLLAYVLARTGASGNYAYLCGFR